MSPSNWFNWKQNCELVETLLWVGQTWTALRFQLLPPSQSLNFTDKGFGGTSSQQRGIKASMNKLVKTRKTRWCIKWKAVCRKSLGSINSEGGQLFVIAPRKYITSHGQIVDFVTPKPKDRVGESLRTSRMGFFRSSGTVSVVFTAENWTFWLCRSDPTGPCVLIYSDSIR